LPVDLVAIADGEDLLDGALADQDVRAIGMRNHHRETTAGEIERDLVDLGKSLVDAEDLVHLHVLEHGNVEEVLQSRLEMAVEIGVLENARRLLAANVEIPLQDNAVLRQCP